MIATFKRVPNVPNSPASFAFFVRPDRRNAVPPTNTHCGMKTDKPHPLLPNDLGAIMILPKTVAETAKTEDFNSGKAMIGTGAYRLTEYVAGDRVVLKRNDAYWGTKPTWDNVRFKMIPSSPARVAALLAGDVQMIEGVPTADIEPSCQRTRACRSRLRGVEPDHLPAHGLGPREEFAVRDDRRRQAAGSQSAARSARAQGDQQDDRP